MIVDLTKPGASDAWGFLQKEASIREGELVLDSRKQPGLVAGFLKEPILGDLTLTFRLSVR